MLGKATDLAKVLFLTQLHTCASDLSYYIFPISVYYIFNKIKVIESND